MIKRILWMLPALFALLAGAGFGEEPVEPVLKDIHQRYQDLAGLEVAYSREVITRSMSMLGDQVKGDLASGAIYFRPPHSLRLEQETPEAETLVANADTIYWYVPRKKRAYKYPAKEFGKEIRLLGNIFQGLQRVEDGFETEMAESDEPGIRKIVLRPTPPWEELDYIVLSVEAEGDIRVVDIHNAMGTITRFTLEQLEPRADFEKDFFQFTVPEGVELMVEREDPADEETSESQQ